MSTKKKDYRILPARLPQTVGIGILGVSGMSMIVLISMLNHVYAEYKSELAQHQKVVEKYEYWNTVIKEHPQFPVGYYEAAVYAIQLGENEKASFLLQRALILDPNFYQAEKLAKEIEE